MARRRGVLLDPLAALMTTYRKPRIPFGRYCALPHPPRDVVTLGVEEPPSSSAVSPATLDEIWRAARRVYATGLHPAIQVAIYHEGRLVLNRAIGHARGNDPDSPPHAPKSLATPDTPFVLYSASKALTAALTLKLDEVGAFHIEDRVADWIPEFAKHGKEHVTIRHVLTHKAGLPLMPVGAGTLPDEEAVIAALCDAKPASRPGSTLAYHAVSGGYLLGEVARRATGESPRTLLRRHVAEPLGLRWTSYGAGDDATLEALALDAFTGPPVLPPGSWLIERALGGTMDEVVRVANSDAFRRAVIPAGNAISTARELARFYACLAAEGELDGVRVFDERTVRRLASEQSYYEIDRTLLAPQRWGLGVMLGDRISMFGLEARGAFGHLGFTNILGWADRERRLGVGLVNNGKPFITLGALPLIDLVRRIAAAFPRAA